MKETPPPAPQPKTARTVAFEVLQRIETKGAFSNLVLSPALDRSGLSDRDKGFVTELVYGSTRMRRALDYAVDRFLLSEVDPVVRTLLRMGAYQIIFMRTPPHAAVGETVELAPRKVSGLINAVLRRVSDQAIAWPDIGTELSYPDWLVAHFVRDHGEVEAQRALAKMNEAPAVVERADGYVQDTASQWVVDEVEASPETRVIDVCAAPGGKATALAATGAPVVAADRRTSRVGLIVENAKRLDAKTLRAIVADATVPPFAPYSFDRVLVDAPCSGLGVLRRRADARWRVEPEAPSRLAELQRSMILAAATLVAPGGILVYSVCTMTAEETTGVLPEPLPGFEAAPLCVVERWRPWGFGGLILPQDHDTDGMAVFRMRRTDTAADR